MAKKNPNPVQFNVTTGKRLYAQSDGGYVARMKRMPDRAIEYALKAYKGFMAHSEFKKPYASTEYEDMEYGLEPINWPPINPGPWPNPGPDPEVPPGPDPGGPPSPSPGPSPGPIPAPGPDPYTPGPPPIYNLYFCDIPSFDFCINGPPVTLPINTNDPISQATGVTGDQGSIQVGGKGGSAVFTPGGTGSVTIHVTTQHGATCIGYGNAKDPAECSQQCGAPSIGYTTTQMGTGETQQLTVVGGSTGPYTWGISSGGGSISSSGLYTAPASNANCTNNPVITLMCGSTVMATLSIAVNAVADPATIAYYAKGLCKYTGSAGACECNCSNTGPGYGYHKLTCGGVDLGIVAYSCSGGPYNCGIGDLGNPCTEPGCPAYVDIRTPDLILLGCCPSALL